MLVSADPHLVRLPTIDDPQGKLTFIEADSILPFEIRRAYYIYGIPQHAERGGHAHKNNQEIVVALSGAFSVNLEDQEGETFCFHLDDPGVGLIVPAMHWRKLHHYAAGSICLVLASKDYDPDEYLRDYVEFKAFMGSI